MSQSVILTLILLVTITGLMLAMTLGDIRDLERRGQTADICKVWVDAILLVIFSDILMTGMFGEFITSIMRLVK